MPEKNRRRNLIIIVLLAIIVLVLLLLLRCSPAKTAAPERVAGPAPAPSPPPAAPADASSGAKEPAEVLTPATVKAPEQVTAGAGFTVTWTGPNNPRDYLTVVKKDAPATASAEYRETKAGPTLEFTAPIDPGVYEVRYSTIRSHTVLGRAAFTVVPAGATLDAAAEVVLGAKIAVSWTGPNNRGDFITLVPRENPDEKYGNYTLAREGSPLTVTAPTTTGDAELRYMTGQGNKVLGRRPVRIVMPDISLSAGAEAIAGTTVQVTWTGPDNNGDYITLVPKDTPDGQYGNYAVTRTGSPLPLVMPIMAGEAELRYMTGQGNQVLGRRPLRVVAAEVSLSAPAEAAAGSVVSITWVGPKNPGDYLTIVAAAAADGQYGNYTNANAGSPLTVKAPETGGDFEIRYMTGQGGKVLARRPIRITP